MAKALFRRHEVHRRHALESKARSLRIEVERISSKVYEARVAELSTRYALDACGTEEEDDASAADTELAESSAPPSDTNPDPPHRTASRSTATLAFHSAHQPTARATIARRSSTLPPPRPEQTAAAKKQKTCATTNLAKDFLAETANAEPRVLLETHGETCPCGGKLLVTPSKALMRCQLCGKATTILDTVSSSLSFDENYSYSSFSYERLSHFLDHLSRAQGKCLYTPKPEFLREIMLVLQRDGVKPEELSVALVRATMKKMKISSKVREHAPLIYSRLSGRPLAQLTTAQEEKLRLQFLAMQAPFAKHIPSERKNFCSYSCVLHRLLILNGFDAILPCVALLSGKGKTEQQDEVLSKIFTELNWEFNTGTTPATPEVEAPASA